jgi:hypothetical protein
VSYHVRELARKGMVELVRTEPRRGALAHYYRLTDAVVLSPHRSTVRALQRSMSRLAGEPVEWTSEAFAEAMQSAAVRAGAAKGSWSSLSADEQMRMRRVADELLRGVAGA